MWIKIKMMHSSVRSFHKGQKVPVEAGGVGVELHDLLYAAWIPCKSTCICHTIELSSIATESIWECSALNYSEKLYGTGTMATASFMCENIRLHRGVLCSVVNGVKVSSWQAGGQAMCIRNAICHVIPDEL